MYAFLINAEITKDNILLPKGEEEIDASDTTSGGFSSASSCEEHALGDSSVSAGNA